MKLLVVMGRGGTGKTSFVALTARYLIEKGIAPLLLVDADPDQNLAEAVGIDLEKEGRLTISELLVEVFREGRGAAVGVPPSERVESRIWSDAMFEGDFFDLIAIGTKWVEGCYCLPNAALKAALEKVTRNYRYILIDSPAGLEHLNRRITSRVDDIFDILDSSKKAFDHVRRAQRIIREVGIEFKNFYLVGGYKFLERLEKSMPEDLRASYLGRIAFDKAVEEYMIEGRSLLELPESSPAYQSIQEILKKAGY